MLWKEVVRDYLTFTRKEKIGIIAVLLLIVIALFLPGIFSYWGATGQQKPDTAWITAAKQLEQKKLTYHKAEAGEDEPAVATYLYEPSTNSYTNKSEAQLFQFDPNTLSKDGWKKLGLRDKTIATIQNYISKGGRFKKAEDFQRIYGLHKNEYERLATYIKIEAQSLEKENTFAEAKGFPADKPNPEKSSRYGIVNINTADTTAFINLPGIGSKLAARIVNFREKLGGFHTIEQVKETFGLPDSTFQKIKQYLVAENVAIKKINVNTATIDELKSHPYIRYNIANAIVAYRNHHGSFSNLQDLRKIMIITEEVHQKIILYLTL